jgi:hypothetical protein
MKLYERLGIDLQEDITLESRLLMLALADSPEPVDQASAEFLIYQELARATRHQVALAYYLLEDHQSAWEHATAAVAQVEGYLFGGWRDCFADECAVPDAEAPDGCRRERVLLGRAGCRRLLPWMAMWHTGLVWALSLGHQEAVARLAEYPGPDVTDEADAEVDFGPANKAAFLVLARVLRGDRTACGASETAIIHKVRKKKPRLLLAALDRIVAQDGVGFQKAWVECLRYHIQRELPKRGLDNKLALDATILYYTARRTGMEIEIPDKHRDHVIRLRR